MTDVIQRLLEVEKEARRIIAEAEDEAAQTVDRARDEARRIIADGRKQAQTEAEELSNRQVQTLQQQKEERLQQEKARLPSADGIDRQRLANAVEFVRQVVAYGEATAE